MVGFKEAIGLYYSNYTNFAGRSIRSEYWWIQLYMALIVLVPSFILGATFGASGYDGSGGGSIPILGWIVLIALVVFILAHIIPSIALSVRRFHDLGQTGWLVLVFAVVGLIPLVGLLTAIGQIVWFCLRGTVGDNQYGPDPLGGQGFV